MYFSYQLTLIQQYNMKATLKKLSGKYYGTEIRIDFQDGHEPEIIKLWDNGNYVPSKRELESMGYTEEQWRNNEEVDNGYDGKTPIQELDLICDSHFESETTYIRAMKIIYAINNC